MRILTGLPCDTRTRKSARPKTKPALGYPIIVHSHLGWDWVWQRPQQFLSRLSERHRVLFIEAPIASQAVKLPEVTLREISDFPNIVVLQIKVPASRWSDNAWV